MKRFLLSVGLCISLLGLFSLFLARTSRAKEDVIQSLLDLPAPPPPNPLSPPIRGERPEKFYDRKNPPPDDAPIEDLLDYWKHQNGQGNRFGYNPTPSDIVVARLIAEIDKDPKLIGSYINVLGDSKRGVEFAKHIFDQMPADGEDGEDEGEGEGEGGEYEGGYSRGNLRDWLTNNSPYFSESLARTADNLHDTEGYVTNHRELINLTRTNWDRARPIVDRAYGDATQPIGQTAARWALYKHALQEESIGDIDRYRQELMDVVANKTLPAGQRDLALDALLTEKEWSGRDDWYISLFNDETLLDLGTYTGLTTMMLWAPDDRYIPRMVELLKSDNVNVRTAAARNLTVILSPDKPEVVAALLPWLLDPKWAKDVQGARARLVQALQTVKLPESVPGLIAALDEKETRKEPDYGAYVYSMSNINAVNRAAIAMNAAANTANAAARFANADTNGMKMRDVTYFPLRSAAITALGNQGDSRAAAPLKRVFNQVEQYERQSVVSAILKCNGFTLAEQINALESFIEDLIAQKKAVNYMREAGSGFANSAANVYAPGAYSSRANLAANAITLDDSSDGYAGVRFDLNYLLGSTVATTRDVSEDLASAAIRRVGELEKTKPEAAEAMRSVITSWRSRAVNSFLLNDVKSGKASSDAVVRLLTIRKELREGQPGNVSDIRSGSPAAAGISACLMESDNDYVSILEGRSDEAKKSLLACGRLIRAKLAIKTVGPLMQSADKQLSLAAERYLESEDSPEARRLLLSAHPGEAKVLGATVAFRGEKAAPEESSSLAELFASVVPGNWIESQYYLAYSISQFDDEEKKLQNEVLSSPDLSGIYAYGDSVVRIYKDKATFSRQEDESRYRERTLEKEEYETLKSYLARSRVDELPPFLSCPNDCAAKELIMLSRAGGRRVYVRSENKPDFFSGLESIFDDMARRPGKLKYWLAAEIPGLEIIFANDRYRAESVWKNGNDLRILIADKVKEKEINKEIRQKAREEGPEYMNTSYTEAARRRFEHYSWRGSGGGELGTVETAPPQNFFLPSADDLSPPADQETWKAGAGKFELRASIEGLFKVSGGKSVKIATGSFSSPIVTASGRWAIANRFDPDDGPAKLVRVDLLTNRVTPVRNADDTSMNPVAYVASVNRFLIGLRSSDSEYDEVQNGYDDGTGTYFWLSPETGQITATGAADLRPIAQQRFRPLQPSTTPFEFWAAIPHREKGETTFGLYSSKSFTMRPVLRLPRIRFNSQLMWVDEAASRVYFVYEGHVLAVPFKR